MRQEAAEPLNVDVDGERLVITIGIGQLVWPPRNRRPDPTVPGTTDRAAFARDVAAALRAGRAEGETPVHRMLDAVALDVTEHPPYSHAAEERRRAVEATREADRENPVRGLGNGIVIAVLLWIILLLIGWIAFR